jgi:hypothetical protein
MSFLQFIKEPDPRGISDCRSTNRAPVTAIGAEQPFDCVCPLILRKIKPTHLPYPKKISGRQEHEFSFPRARRTNGEKNSTRTIRPPQPQLSSRKDGGGATQHMILTAQVSTQVGLQLPQIGDSLSAGHF